MRGEFGYFFPFFFFLLVVTVLVLGQYMKKKRAGTLEAWAQANGWNFDPGKDDALEGLYPAFGCLHEGRNRYAFNVIQGQFKGRPLTAFDYRYVVQQGKQSAVIQFSAVVLHSDVPLEPLFIRPENFLDKVADFFGHNDIDFESAEFSRKFCVKAPDRKWAYDVLQPRTIQMLLEMPQFIIQFDQQSAIAYLKRTFSVTDFQQAMTVLGGILDGMPNFVVEDREKRV